MQLAEFVTRVEKRGPGRGAQAARAASVATLHEFYRHMSPEEARKLASQLPQELTLAIAYAPRPSETVDMHEFYAKIAEQAGVSMSEATDYARAVAQVLRQAVTSGEVMDVVLDLPGELDELLA